MFFFLNSNTIVSIITYFWGLGEGDQKHKYHRINEFKLNFSFDTKV
jgi:hypothetical protein